MGLLPRSIVICISCGEAHPKQEIRHYSFFYPNDAIADGSFARDRDMIVSTTDDVLIDMFYS